MTGRLHHWTIPRGTIPLGVILLGCVLAARSLAATPAEYDGALAQVQHALSAQARAVGAGAPLPAGLDPTHVAARALAPVRMVQPPGGPPRPVNTLLLRQAITAAEGEGDRKRHVQRLQELAAQVSALRRDMAASDAAPGAARKGVDAARAVLAGETYDVEPLPDPTWWEQARNRMQRALERWLDSLPRSHSRPPPSINPNFINGIVIALGVALFALLVSLLVGLLRRRAAVSRPMALDETEAALVEARDTDSLHALAERKAREGDYRLALRFIYLALLVALDTGGVLKFDRSRTNWEYLRALRASGRDDVYLAMTPLTREFDRIWYGQARADAADYARALSQYEALQAATQTAPTPTRGKAASTA